MGYALWRRCRDEDTTVLKRVQWRPEGCCQAREWSGQEGESGVRKHGRGRHILGMGAGMGSEVIGIGAEERGQGICQSKE